MKIPLTFIVVTALNCGLVLVNLAQTITPAGAQSTPSVLRARALQIVDERDQVRASLEVLTAGISATGVRPQETVLLRLITERGRPSVKIGASEQVSGISLAGPTGTKDTYAILEADTNVSSLKLRSENGREQVIKP
ncbi:MAG: hypothetical protein ABWY07_09805 [Burkholderiales bacterium]